MVQRPRPAAAPICDCHGNLARFEYGSFPDLLAAILHASLHKRSRIFGVRASVSGKVFGIGFQKSGTTTLGAMLSALGYRVAGYHSFRDLANDPDLDWRRVEARALEVMENHDAAKDTPWPLLYPFLDTQFPGSKFVHIIRDPEAWISSAVRDFADHPNALHQLIYGTPFPKGHEKIWLERYKAHNFNAAAYFKGRDDSYLQLRLEDLSYTALCPFLGKPLIAAEPPRSNTRLKKKFKMLWWKVKSRIG